MENLLAQGQVRHQALQATVIVLELLQLLDVAGRHLTELLLPSIEGLLASPKLPAELRSRQFMLGLLQDQCDLLGQKTALPHREIFPL
jgi:hypothetical protein